ncbi:unnamed protein product [Phytophthora fragariaefolia]|uniref:Unnamed protein product n=1 Tax=Phytophthora fragariaefolia TaxID=1490495 RepID=A0A9W6TSI4_9STRA|nr:unnamed protein product [Phytophthora fragariaefolia]
MSALLPTSNRASSSSRASTMLPRAYLYSPSDIVRLGELGVVTVEVTTDVEAGELSVVAEEATTVFAAADTAGVSAAGVVGVLIPNEHDGVGGVSFRARFFGVVFAGDFAGALVDALAGDFEGDFAGAFGGGGADSPADSALIDDSGTTAVAAAVSSGVGGSLAVASAAWCFGGAVSSYRTVVLLANYQNIAIN